MKFFLDSANINEIEEIASLGLLDGVTTNPSLVAKENGQQDFAKIIKKICKIAKGPVSAEVISTEFENMIKEAEILSKIDKNVVIKLPMTKDGIKATSYLSKKKIPVNVTLIFSASQALIAAKAGAAYVSPFVGRLDDISSNGMNLISDLSEIFLNYYFPEHLCRLNNQLLNLFHLFVDLGQLIILKNLISSRMILTVVLNLVLIFLSQYPKLYVLKYPYNSNLDY